VETRYATAGFGQALTGSTNRGASSRYVFVFLQPALAFARDHRFYSNNSHTFAAYTVEHNFADRRLTKTSRTISDPASESGLPDYCGGGRWGSRRSDHVIALTLTAVIRFPAVSGNRNYLMKGKRGRQLGISAT